MTPAAVLVLAGCLAGATASKGPSLSPQAAALVRPILSALFVAHAEEFDPTGRLLGRSPHHDVIDELFGARR
jgi:hypothetical protein